MISFFKTIIYIPLYNLLAVILNMIPNQDAGVAIIILTLLVKFILYPISKKAAVAQAKLKRYSPELEEIKEKYKDREEQAVQTLAFYKKYGINPFGSLLPIFIQIPIIYSLYHIFLHSGLPLVNTDLLYSFITPPEIISMNFLGLIDVAARNIWLAILAALSTYFQIKLAAPETNNSSKSSSFGSDLASQMASQMKYTFPIIVFFISWKVSGAVALYWFVSNLFAIGQDYWIKKKLV